MSKAIDPEKLQQEIMDTLKQFEKVTEEAAAKGVQETAQKAVNELHNVPAHEPPIYRDWDAYNAGWTSTLKKRKNVWVETVHNAKKYRLTHLLEYGHAKANGGRTRAFPHIAPVAEKAEEELVDNILKNIQQ